MMRLLTNDFVETGSNENGYYRKWSDGTLECWQNIDVSVSADSTSGLHRIDVYNIWKYPVPFVGRNPTVSIVTQSSSDYVYCSVYGILRNKEKVTNITFLRLTQVQSIFSVGLGLYAIGRWK